jgi:hypothetical protein
MRCMYEVWEEGDHGRFECTYQVWEASSTRPYVGDDGLIHCEVVGECEVGDVDVDGTYWMPGTYDILLDEVSDFDVGGSSSTYYDHASLRYESILSLGTVY